MGLTRGEILSEQERLIRLQPMVESKLKLIPGVDHVGVGVKEVGGRLSEELCFRVYVHQKKAASMLPAEGIVPAMVMGVKTDIISRSELIIISDRGRHRPLRGGIQVRSQRIDGKDSRLSGTLGMLVTSISSSSGKLMALTCEHVVSQGVFSPSNPNAVIGMQVGQPTYSTCCCCVCGDIGTVFKVQKDATVDCALVDLKSNLLEDISSSSMQNMIEGIGAITGVAQAVCFEHVRKRGAGTEITEGIVIEVIFDGSQILIRPAQGHDVFADFGDSGAVIVNDANKIIGLLWGANRNNTSFLNSSSSGTFLRKEGVANHIGAVMGALGITIAGQNSSGLAIPAINCGVEAPAPSLSSRSSTSLSSQSSAAMPGSSSSSRSSSSSSSRSSSSSSSRGSCVPDPNHKHAGASKSVRNLIGCKVNIMTRAMPLACEPTATFTTFSTVWAGVVNNGVSRKWAQMGITRRRTSPATAVAEYIKCETKAGPNAADYDNTIVPPAGFPAFPVAGVAHDYECVLEQATGKWKYLFDGREIHTFTNAGWIHEVADRVDFTGEVYDPGSFLAGNSANKCRLSGCQYKVVTYASSSSSRSSGISSSSSSSRLIGVPQAYVSAGLVAAQVSVSDALKFGAAWVSGDTIDLWDKRL